MNWADKMLASSRYTTYFLKRYYIGKFLGAERLQQLVLESEVQELQEMLIKVFRNEKKHLGWIEQLLLNRGLPLPRAGWRKTRYWKPVLKQLTTFEEHMAIAFYITEEMHQRTLDIKNSKFGNIDITHVFSRILTDEAFAISTFRACTTPKSLIDMKPIHQRGLNKLYGRN